MTVHEYPRNHGSLAGLTGTDHHAQYALMVPGPSASRPNPSRYGRLYSSTDTGVLSFDTGTQWIDLVQSTTQSAADAAQNARLDALEAQMAMEVAN